MDRIVYITDEFKSYMTRVKMPIEIKTILERWNRSKNRIGSTLEFNNIEYYQTNIGGVNYYIVFAIRVFNSSRIYIPKILYTDQPTLKNDIKNNSSKFDLSEAEMLEINNAFDNSTFTDVSLPASMQINEDDKNFDIDKGYAYIYEMGDWVSHIGDYSTQWGIIFNNLEEIVVKNNYSNVIDNKGVLHNSGVLYKCQIDDFQIAFMALKGNQLFYLFDIQEAIDLDALIEKYQLNNGNNTNVLRRAKRGYPSLILCGSLKKDWEPIEKDEDANLALSDNEIMALSNAEYPFFVNGLAGSGKSTILYYLFSYAFYNCCKNNRKLLFLSYNKKLVEQAKSKVSTLLFVNSKYFAGEEFDRDLIESKLKGCFVPFIDFLKDKFLAKGTLSRRHFNKRNYMDYETFKNLFQSNPYRNSSITSYKEKPIVIWSVIRSFIKGDNIDVEGYKQLPIDKRTVSVDTFSVIYDIYLHWYKPQMVNISEIADEDGDIGSVLGNTTDNVAKYWDDLDLVNYALLKIGREEQAEYVEYYRARDRYETSYSNDELDSQNENLKNIMNSYDEKFANTLKYKYDIIYCDESQDFTPVEIRLLLKLSAYSGFKLENYCGIPISFAGDPNQTITPTGFKWNITKQIFNRSFNELKSNNNPVKINEINLYENYRSKITIVQFANLIQYIRTKYLDVESMPQEVWDSESNSKPLFLTIDKDSVLLENFLNRDEVNCVITGDEGEFEIDVIKDEKGQNKEVLSEDSIQIEDDLLKNIEKKTKLYTSTSSKGQEFHTVVLYRFADGIEDNWYEKLLNPNNSQNDVELYNLSHFFTKLYIAITRAKVLLVIIDTKDNYDKFWVKFDEAENNRANYFITDALKDNSKWFQVNEQNETMGGLEKVSDIKEITNKLDKNYSIEKDADKHFNDALYSDSAYDMRKTASLYNQAKKFDIAQICIAYALRRERRYKESGELFEKFESDFGNALESFWEGKCWNNLKKSEYRIYSIIAKYMDNELSIVQFISTPRLIENINSDDDTWNEVLLKMKNDMNAYNGNRRKICQFLDILTRNSDYSSFLSLLAMLYYKDGDYENARKVWRGNDLTLNNKYYNEVEEKLADSPSDKIYWMDKNKKNKEIIDTYYNSVDELNDNAKNIIFEILVADSKYFNKAFEYIKNKLKMNKSALEKLYTKEPYLFANHYIFSDFTIDKFSEWVEDRIVNSNDYRLYSDRVPKETYDKLFAIENNDWIKYFQLQDRFGRRAISNISNRANLLDSLSRSICASVENKPLATCFLEMLFIDNNLKYNIARCDNYKDTIVYIFTNNSFDRNDFMISRTNTYSRICNLSLTDIYSIHENICDYIQTKMKMYSSSSKKLSKSDSSYVKLLCNIYNLVLPFAENEENPDKKIVDESKLLKFYNDILDNEKLKLIHPFVKGKKLSYQLRYKTISSDEFFSSFENKEIKKDDYFDSLDKEDFVTLLLNTLTKQTFNSAINNWALDIAKLFYKFNFDGSEVRSEHFRINCLKIVDANLVSKIDSELTDLNNQYFTFMREKVCSKRDNALFFDRFQKSIRREEYRTYYQKRALYYYATGDFSENDFDKKRREYPIPVDKDFAKGNVYPVIAIIKKEEVVMIEANQVIDGISVSIVKGIKTILFNQGSESLAMINNGQIVIINSNLAHQNESILYIDPVQMVIMVNSNTDIDISSNGKRYKIKL